jgi:hypothetical protein
LISYQFRGRNPIQGMKTEMATDRRSLREPSGRHQRSLLGAAFFFTSPIVPALGLAQTASANNQAPVAAGRATESANDTVPLTDSERFELLQLTPNLQEPVTTLESRNPGAAPSTAPDAKPKAPAGASGAPTIAAGPKVRASEKAHASGAAQHDIDRILSIDRLLTAPSQFFLV